MKTILSIVGARPQFIKYAPLSLELKKYFKDICLHTGQHYDDSMSQIFFNELGITEPEYNLKIGSGKQGMQTSQMITGIEEVMLSTKPSAVVLFGDTNSTLAGAVAASKLKAKIIHIEAGLRSFNKDMPEEVNRIITDHVSDILFAPTKEAIKNLNNEGINGNIFQTGDLMIDTQRMGLEYIKDHFDSYSNKPIEVPYILSTIHRNYNTNDPIRLRKIFSALNELDENIILPIHPRTKLIAKEYGIRLLEYPNVKFIEPQGYFSFLNLLKNSKMIITDSGGIQKEAYNLKIPCITLRYETEWKETLKGNWNVLIGESLDKLPSLINTFPQNHKKNLYGSGHAAVEIVEIIKEIVR